MALCGLGAPPARAAGTGYSQVLLVRGDDTTLTSEMSISSWGFDSGSTGLHGFGGGEGRFVTADSAHLIKPIGKDSQELMGAVAKGTHFKELRFQATKAGTSSAYFRVCFTDVLLSSSQLGFGNGGNSPEERIGFSYDEAKYDYAPSGQLADGCGSKKSPALNAWMIKLGGHKATIGVSCLSEVCRTTVELVSSPGQCLASKRATAKGCPPIGTAKATINGGKVKTLKMGLDVGKATLLQAGEPIRLIGLLKDQGPKLLDRDALAVPAVQKPSETTLTCPGTGTIGARIAFTGGVRQVKKGPTAGRRAAPAERAGLTPAAGVPVAIELNGPGAALEGTVARTDATGRYASADFTPGVTGNWTAVASSPAGPTSQAGQSSSCGIDVDPHASSLTLSCPAGTIPFSPPTTFSGVLTPAGAGTVAITYTHGATIVSHNSSIAADGSYFDSFTPAPLDGQWTAVAHYPGDASVAPADSLSCSFNAG